MSYPEHNPYHERRVDQQILDTLLRIEALLSKPDATAKAEAAAEVAEKRARRK